MARPEEDGTLPQGQASRAAGVLLQPRGQGSEGGFGHDGHRPRRVHLHEKSTTGIVLRAGSHVVRTQSSTQSAINLSSGESEVYGILKGSSAGLGLRSCLEDFGGSASYPIPVETDSTTARTIACRSDLGQTRHIAT
eukprot:15593495-Heterocapsa_arctica.AAC.1